MAIAQVVLALKHVMASFANTSARPYTVRLVFFADRLNSSCVGTPKYDCIFHEHSVGVLHFMKCCDMKTPMPCLAGDSPPLAQQPHPLPILQGDGYGAATVHRAMRTLL